MLIWEAKSIEVNEHYGGHVNINKDCTCVLGTSHTGESHETYMQSDITTKLEQLNIHPIVLRGPLSTCQPCPGQDSLLFWRSRCFELSNLLPPKTKFFSQAFWNLCSPWMTSFKATWSGNSKFLLLKGTVAISVFISWRAFAWAATLAFSWL